MTDALSRFATGISRHRELYDEIAKSHPSLMNGSVICGRCQKTRTVDAAQCLRSGWPKCCGATMSLQDKPKEEKKP
jgi:hypothetical protein